MLTQFRVRYPQGSLISDLVRVDRGKYIVKATVEVDGITLASGMAAAETVEKAEDLARERALAIVNLDTPPAIEEQKRTPVKNNSPSNKGQKTNKKPISNKISPILTPTINDNKSLFDNPTVVKVETNSINLNSTTIQNSASDLPSSNSVIAESDLNSSAEEIEADPKEIDVIPQPEVELELTYGGEIESQIEIPLPEENEEPEPNLSIQEEQDDRPTQDTRDYSEVIAQTTFQMKRLRWTEQQGRDHLKEYYGVRSRHSLNDSQLLEFLEFLQVQPDPV